MSLLQNDKKLNSSVICIESLTMQEFLILLYGKAYSGPGKK